LWGCPENKVEERVAKATYVKWYRYDPNPEVDSLEAFLRIVDADEYGCFFG
jgi:hypothetical protein